MLTVTIGINPVAFSLGPLAIHWYGIGYVVAIFVGIKIIEPYAAFRRVSGEQFATLSFWGVVGGFTGGRLYYVVQNHQAMYATHPWRILQVWNGGMAFFGAIIGVSLVLAFFAFREHWRWAPLMDVGALFALVAQPFGRLGNVINGDILGAPTHLPWGFVYSNPSSFAASHTTAYQPAAIYEILCNLILIAILFPLRKRFAEGWFAAVYVAGYSISQLVVFVWRTEPVIALGLRQAQYTAIAVLAADLVVMLVLLRRGHRPLAATGPAASSEAGKEAAPPSSVREHGPAPR